MSGGGDITYDAVVMLALFLMAQWYGARLCTSLKFPTIPIEIGIGLLFGPHGADLIPDFSHDYSPLSLLGFIGVGIVIFESGMHLHIDKVCNWDLGPHVVAVACLGTALPIVLGMVVFTAMGFDLYPNGLAAGFSLAPTSVGISLTLLSRAKQLNSRCGQIIMSAAFLDDIFSIICLVIMTNLAEGELDVVLHVIVPLISAMGFVIIGGLISIFIMPKITPYLLNASNIGIFEVESRAMNLKDELHMFYMIAFYIAFSYIGDIIGSALLGAFVAGMLFAGVPRSHLIWEKQFKRITRWLLRLFFSCTVAFSINIGDLFTAEAFGLGLIMGVGPCLLTKLAAGAFVGSERWVVGVAMMARGEFAYLVAAEANYLELISDAQYAVVVWALLWATLIAPLAFDKTLKHYIKSEFEKTGVVRSKMIGGDKFSGASTFIIHYFGTHQVGMVREVCEALHALGFDVIKVTAETTGVFGFGTFEVSPRQVNELINRYGDKTLTDSNALRKYKMVTDLTDEKLNEIAKYLDETLSDPHSQIIFEPCEVEDSDSMKDKNIEIEVFGEGYLELLPEIEAHLKGEECNLTILTEMVDQSSNVDDDRAQYTVFYCHKNGEGLKSASNSPAKSVKSSSTAEKYSANDCQAIRRSLQAFFVSKEKPKCNALVRLVHVDAVVFSSVDTTKPVEKGEGDRTRASSVTGGDDNIRMPRLLSKTTLLPDDSISVGRSLSRTSLVKGDRGDDVVRAPRTLSKTTFSRVEMTDMLAHNKV